ncbi:MAG TPA: Glu/Leu/Phe/Val dehydrogenase dimerization domain-containing protein, partial [Acidimicrobiales bacterium]|nr:Glu/Leu/Phe/Val dehydrogenase dimerization domain-containing protein [Acidimicrobiales bacterium]
EQLTFCFDRASGMRAVIAIDDTTLGPGLGGVRWQAYPNEQAAADEARRLARVMTLKNACADLPYGGAKSVLIKDDLIDGGDVEAHRHAQLRAFGRFVDRLGGAYIPGVDMGTSIEDLAIIGAVAREVSCDHEDPSPSTALGVFAGIGAALSSTGTNLCDAHVVVQGVGHVGANLARLLAVAGCDVSVADVDPLRAQTVSREIGGRVVDPLAALTMRCDVLAPCATAKVIDRTAVGSLRCRIVAGGANDVLATQEVAMMLDQSGVVYVPDFVINAGGVIQIHALRCEWGPDKLEDSLFAIGDRVTSIVNEAGYSRRTPLTVAEEMASLRLGRPISLPT